MSNTSPTEKELLALRRKLTDHQRAYYGPTVLTALGLLVWFCILLVSCSGCAHQQSGGQREVSPEYTQETAVHAVLPVTDLLDRVRATAVVLKCDPKGPDTLVTAFHVLLVLDKVGVKKAKATAIHPRADLLLVEAELGYGCYAAQLAEKPTVGGSVLVVGSANGRPDTQTRGRITQIYWTEFYTRKRHRIVQSTALVRPGNSGGAMFDEAGRLVGVVTHYRFNPFTGAVRGCADHVDHVRELLGQATP